MNLDNQRNISFISKNLLSRLVVFFVLFLPAAIAFGQAKFSTISSSKEVGRNDYVQVEFVVENAKQIEHLSPPDFPDFHVMQGPIQSSGMSIVNGNMTQYKSVSYVLQPTKTGKFTIPGATAVVDGKSMRSNSVVIEVNNSASQGNSGNPAPLPFSQPRWPDESPAEMDRDYVLKPGEKIPEKIHRNMFVKVQVSKKSCFVGEPIVATYKLYSRLRSESRVSKHPSLNGFSVYDMINPGTDESFVENVNGKPFTVHIIRKAQLVPLQAGIVPLDQVEVENTVHFIRLNENAKPRKHQNLLDELFDQFPEEDGTPVEQNITLSSEPVSIDVKALPEKNKPADFNGAVGNYTIEAALENKHLSTSDGAILKVTVKGKGNLPVVNAPVINWPADIDAFDPVTKEDLNKSVAPISGSKSFEYSFSAKKKGSYTIPAISFSYFDPVKADYQSISTAEIPLDVAAGKKQDVSNASKTSLPAETGKNEENGVKQFVQNHLEWLFAILILSGLAVYLYRQNLKLRHAEAIKKAKEEEEKKLAAAANETHQQLPQPDLLQRAKRMLENQEYPAFYLELNRAMWELFQQKLNLLPSESNKLNVIYRLRKYGWNDEHIARIENILSTCEMNLYTPAYDPLNMQHLLSEAEFAVSAVRSIS